MDLVIIGAGEVARMAYHYFSQFSPYTPRAFAVDPEYLTSSTLLGVPLLELDAARALYPPASFQAFVALSMRHNQARRSLYLRMKEWGYTCASFLHPKSDKGPAVVIGENVFIQEYNNLQHGVRIGDNVFIWAKNHIGHQTMIGSHSFLASGITISGYCEIGEEVILGSGVTTRDKIVIGDRAFVGQEANVVKDLPGGGTYVGNPARLIQPKQEARES